MATEHLMTWSWSHHKITSTNSSSIKHMTHIESFSPLELCLFLNSENSRRRSALLSETNSSHGSNLNAAVTSGLRMRGTDLGVPRQLAQSGDQGLGHLLRAALEESAAASEEQSVACEHQLVLRLKQERS